MHCAPRSLLTLLAGFAIACSDTTIKVPIAEPVPPPGVFDYCEENINGHDVYVSSKAELGEVSCRRGRAEAAVYGTSLTSGFRLKEGDFPSGRIEGAFNDTVSDYVREGYARAKERDADVPAPVQGVLSVENEKVLARYKARCPTYFARETMWTPTELRWDYSTFAPGNHDSGRDWDYQGRYVVTGVHATAVTGIAGDRRGKSYAQTQQKATGAAVGELGNLEKLSAEALELQTTPSRIYLNDVLAHEMGHWTFTQIGWEEGRSTALTKYFAEVTASWIASLCYFNPIEKAEYREWLRKDDDPYNEYSEPQRRVSIDQSLPNWPAKFPISIYENEKPILRSEGPAEGLQYYSAGDVLALTYYAMHELNGPQDPNRLFGITLDSIKKMKGRKMECYDKEWCAGANWFQTIAWPLSKKPLIHTLAEFLDTLESGLKEDGLFPARVQPLWDANKRKMNRFEK